MIDWATSTTLQFLVVLGKAVPKLSRYTTRLHAYFSASVNVAKSHRRHVEFFQFQSQITF